MERHSPSNPPLLLTLDQGGHASRALVFDAAGRIVAQAVEEIATRCPQPDWAEHDGEEIVASLYTVAARVLRALGADKNLVVAAGLATQRSNVVCWDRVSGAALSPVISWQDRRAQASLAQFGAQAEHIHRATGLFLTAHYGATKLRWCLDNLPAVRAALREGRLACGPMSSFLTFRLLTERPLVADPANAARTLLWNLRTRDWDSTLLELFGVPRAPLPACVPTCHAFGTLAIDGMHLPLRVVTGDQSAALFGFGAPRTEVAYVNIGTGAFVQRVSGHHPGYSPQLLTGVVLHDDSGVTYTLEGTVNGAGSALTWIEAQLGMSEREAEANAPEWLARANEPPLFLNGVSGLGSPFWVPHFDSRFIGAGAPWQMIVAVIESIVFLLEVNLEAMLARAHPPAEILASGGLAVLDGLCQRLADLSRLPVYRPQEHEASARGVAYLLAPDLAAWSAVGPGEWFRPQPNVALIERYRRWRAAMAAVTNPEPAG